MLVAVLLLFIIAWLPNIIAEFIYFTKAYFSGGCQLNELCLHSQDAINSVRQFEIETGHDVQFIRPVVLNLSYLNLNPKSKSTPRSP